MARLAIQGHLMRGSEVIALLEMLGGKNNNSVGGAICTYIYFINDDNNIELLKLSKVDETFVIFTLEEFEEKFPYKVRDEVLYKTYGIYLKIKSMRWNKEKNRVFYRLDSNKLFVATVDELKPCKQQ